MPESRPAFLRGCETHPSFNSSAPYLGLRTPHGLFSSASCICGRTAPVQRRTRSVRHIRRTCGKLCGARMQKRPGKCTAEHVYRVCPSGSCRSRSLPHAALPRHTPAALSSIDVSLLSLRRRLFSSKNGRMLQTGASRTSRCSSRSFSKSRMTDMKNHPAKTNPLSFCLHPSMLLCAAPEIHTLRTFPGAAPIFRSISHRNGSRRPLLPPCRGGVPFRSRQPLCLHCCSPGTIQAGSERALLSSANQGCGRQHGFSAQADTPFDSAFLHHSAQKNHFPAPFLRFTLAHL